MRLALVCSMAFHEYAHERILSLCAVLALATVLAPLLLFFGVRNGVLSTLQTQLLNNPRTLEIIPIGSGKYDAHFFATLRTHPHVAYSIPQTRSIAATIELLPLQQARTGLRPKAIPASLIPSGLHDPVLLHYAPGTDTRLEKDPHGIVLTAELAQKLHVRAGDMLTGRLGRSRGLLKESAEIVLEVLGIVPLEAMQKDAVFASLPLLQASEQYRDGYAVPRFDWKGNAPQQDLPQFPSFRLYARSLEGVAVLRDFLQAQRIDVYTRAEEIESIRHLDRATSLIFGLICTAAAVGFLASTASTLVAAIRRKERILGVIRLLGFSGLEMMCFPLFQSLLTATLGTGLAFGLYGIISLVINQLFAHSAGTVCVLGWQHVLYTFCIVLGLSLLAALPPGIRCSRIAPAEVLRNE